MSPPSHAPANTPTVFGGSGSTQLRKVKDKSLMCAYFWLCCCQVHRLYLGDFVGCLVGWLTSGLCYLMTILDIVNMDLLVFASEYDIDLPLLAVRSKFPPAICDMH